jgi:hypothetical protein
MGVKDHGIKGTVHSFFFFFFLTKGERNKNNKISAIKEPLKIANDFSPSACWALTIF